MSNQPDPNSKLDLAKNVFGNSTASPVDKDPSKSPTMNTASIVGLLVWFCCVLCSSIGSATNSQAAGVTAADAVNLAGPGAGSVSKGGDGPFSFLLSLPT